MSSPHNVGSIFPINVKIKKVYDEDGSYKGGFLYEVIVLNLDASDSTCDTVCLDAEELGKPLTPKQVKKLMKSQIESEIAKMEISLCEMHDEYNKLQGRLALKYKELEA